MKIPEKITAGIMVFFLLSTTMVGVSITGNGIAADDFEKITLDFTFPTPTVEKVEINGELYERVTIDGLPNSGGINQPSLPVKSVKVLIPSGREFDSVEVVAKDKSLLELNYAMEVGQNIIPLNTDLSQQFSEKDYSDPSSDNLYSIVDAHLFRGYSILFVNLHPVQYIEKTGELAYYEQLTLQIKTKDSQSINVIRGLQRDKEIVAKLVDNPSYILSYNRTSGLLGENNVNYVIITNEMLANSGLEDNLQYFAQSKIDKGLSANIFTVEEIVSNPEFSVNGTWGDNNPDNPFYKSEITENFEMFDDTQAKIRNFIRYVHVELGTDYVLLAGDADGYSEEDNIIPVRRLYACEEGLPLDMGTLDLEEDNIPSDVYYACLDGNFNFDMDERWGENATDNNIADVEEADLLAEVYVGRACVDSDVEVANFVMKTLGYESSDEDLYLAKALMVGERLGFPGLSLYGGNYMDVIIPSIPEDFNVDTLYERDTNWDKYDLIDILNVATPHLVNHLGHGFVNYALMMKNQDILSLTNDKYFFIYSQTCLAGSFDNCYRDNYYEDDCAAEYFTVETPHGAFAVIMNARFGLGSENTLYAPSQILDESFFKALFTEDIRQLGRANHYSKEDHIWHINENGIRWVYYETNLLGDPEVAIKDPSSSNVELTISVTHPQNDGLLYILNRKICPIPLLRLPIIIGKITFQVEAFSDPEGQVFSVEFYLDDESQLIDSEPPYEWETNSHLTGRHTITVIAHGIHGEKESVSNDVIFFIPGL
jgi:hypothetical protein